MAKKRYIILIYLSITIMLITASCSQNGSTKDTSTSETPKHHTEQSSNSTPDTMDNLEGKTYTNTAYILDIDLQNNTIMIGASMDTDYFQQTHVLLKDSTTILINGIPSQLEDLAIGNQILITYTGGIAESAPAQMHWPIQIEVIE